MHAELPIGAFVSAVLVLVPLPWHWRARNVPTLSIIAWLFIANIIYGVNSLIWANNVRIVVPVWCDIVTKLQIGATMSLPACCLCLCIHLERIASVRQAGTSHREKLNRMIFDILMCWGVPVVYMALHYIVQGHRFDIVENFGCRPSIFNSIQSILLIWVPPLLVVVLTLIYAALALHHFMQRRLTFARHLQDSNSALTTSRYFRLMAMAVVQMFWGALLISVNMWFTCRNGLRTWISWEDVHYDFSRVGLFPQRFIPPSIVRWTFFTWWTIPATSALFFMFFAFGQDAVKEYAACFSWIGRVIFRRKQSKSFPSDLYKASRTPSPRVTLPKFASAFSPTQDSYYKADEVTLTDIQTKGSRNSMEKSSFPMTPTSITSFSCSDSTHTIATSTSPPIPFHRQDGLV